MICSYCDCAAHEIHPPHFKGVHHSQQLALVSCVPPLNLRYLVGFVGNGAQLVAGGILPVQHGANGQNLKRPCASRRARSDEAA